MDHKTGSSFSPKSSFNPSTNLSPVIVTYNKLVEKDLKEMLKKDEGLVFNRVFKPEL